MFDNCMHLGWCLVNSSITSEMSVSKHEVMSRKRAFHHSCLIWGQSLHVQEYWRTFLKSRKLLVMCKEFLKEYQCWYNRMKQEARCEAGWKGIDSMKILFHFKYHWWSSFWKVSSLISLAYIFCNGRDFFNNFFEFLGDHNWWDHVQSK